MRNFSCKAIHVAAIAFFLIFSDSRETNAQPYLSSEQVLFAREMNGMDIRFFGNFTLSQTKQGLFGEYLVTLTATVNPVSVLKDFCKIDSKEYYPNSFNNNLSDEWAAVRVKQISFEAELSSTLEKQTKRKLVLAPGEKTSWLVKADTTKSGIGLWGVNITGIELEGVVALHDKIRKFEAEALADEKKRKIEEERANTIKKGLEAVRDLISKNELDKALILARQIQVVAPQNKEAQKLVSQLEKDLANQNKQENKVKELEISARKMEQDGNWEAATAIYEQWLRLQPENETAKTGLQQARKKMDEGRNKEQLIREKLTQLQKTFQKQDYSGTLTLANEILALQPDDQDAKRYKQQAEQKLREQEAAVNADQSFQKKQEETLAEKNEDYEKLDNIQRSADAYQNNLKKKVNAAREAFLNLPESTRTRQCETAEGLAVLAKKTLSDVESAQLYADAAALCPDNPEVKYWIALSAAAFETARSLPIAQKYERKYEEQQAAYLKSAQLNVMLNPGITGYRWNLDKAYKDAIKATRDKMNAVIYEMSQYTPLQERYYDPGKLNSDFNQRLNSINESLNKANRLAGINAGNTYNQSYNLTQNANTAAKSAAVSGAGDIIANTIIASGHQKQLMEDYDSRLHQIYREYKSELEENRKAARNSMIKTVGLEAEKKSYTDYQYFSALYNYTETEFSRNRKGLAWYYNRTFSNTNWDYFFNDITYIGTDEQLQSAQRKIKLYANGVDLSDEWTENFIHRMIVELAGNSLKAKPDNAAAYYLLGLHYKQRIDLYFSKYSGSKVAINENRLHYFESMHAAQRLKSASQTLIPELLVSLKQEMSAYIDELIRDENTADWNSLIVTQLPVALLGDEFSKKIIALIDRNKNNLLRSYLSSCKTKEEENLALSLLVYSVKNNFAGPVAEITQRYPHFSALTYEFERFRIPLPLYAAALGNYKSFAHASFHQELKENREQLERLWKIVSETKSDYLKMAFCNGVAELAIRNDEPAYFSYIRDKNGDFFSINNRLTDNVLKNNKLELIKYLIGSKLVPEANIYNLLYSVKDTRLQLFLLSAIDTRKGDPAQQSRVVMHHINDFSSTSYSAWCNQLNLINNLLNAGFPAAYSEEGSSILHRAVEKGDINLVNILLKSLEKQGAGSAVNQKDRNGNTPLHLAVSKRDMPICFLLRKHGADPSEKNAANTSAKEMAKALKKFDLPDPEKLTDAEKFEILQRFYPESRRGLNKAPVFDKFTGRNIERLFISEELTDAEIRELGQYKMTATSLSDYLRSALFQKQVRMFLFKNRQLIEKETGWSLGSFHEIKSVYIPSVDRFIMGGIENKIKNTIGLIHYIDYAARLDVILSSTEDPNTTLKLSLDIANERGEHILHQFFNSNDFTVSKIEYEFIKDIPEKCQSAVPYIPVNAYQYYRDYERRKSGFFNYHSESYFTSSSTPGDKYKLNKVEKWKENDWQAENCDLFMYVANNKVLSQEAKRLHVKSFYASFAYGFRAFNDSTTLVHFDAFNLKDTWPTYTDSIFDINYVDNTFCLKRKNKGSVYSRKNFNISEDDNFHVRTFVKDIHNTSSEFGIVLGHNDDKSSSGYGEYINLIITQDDRIGLYLYTQSKWVPLQELKPLTKNYYVYSNGAWLGIKKKDDKFSVYLNDDLQFTVPAIKLPGKGFGFQMWAGSGGATVMYDNFEVSLMGVQASHPLNAEPWKAPAVPDQDKNSTFRENLLFEENFNNKRLLLDNSGSQTDPILKSQYRTNITAEGAAALRPIETKATDDYTFELSLKRLSGQDTWHGLILTFDNQQFAAFLINEEGYAVAQYSAQNQVLITPAQIKSIRKDGLPNLITVKKKDHIYSMYVNDEHVGSCLVPDELEKSHGFIIQSSKAQPLRLEVDKFRVLYNP